jgi:hypothetical protein
VAKNDEEVGKNTYVKGGEIETWSRRCERAKRRGEIKKGRLFGAFKADPRAGGPGSGSGYISSLSSRPASHRSAFHLPPSPKKDPRPYRVLPVLPVRPRATLIPGTCLWLRMTVDWSSIYLSRPSRYLCVCGPPQLARCKSAKSKSLAFQPGSKHPTSLHISLLLVAPATHPPSRFAVFPAR